MNQRWLIKLARTAIAEPDEERMCMQCRATMNLPGDLEATALCNTCAQDTVVLLANAYLNLLKNRKAKRG